MACFPRRILAVFTALCVLVMGAHCTCAGVFPVRPGGDCTAHSHACCSEEDIRTAEASHQHRRVCRKSDHHSSQPCDSRCGHCQQSVTDDAPSKGVSLLSVSAWTLVATVPAAPFLSQSPVASPRFPGDLPPPVASPTLLSLCCALNT